jgi:hypothetical protein
MAIKPVDIALFGQNVEPTRRPELSSGLIASFGYFEWNPQPEGHDGEIVEKTVGLLIEQFRRERPFIRGFIESVARSCQEVEDILFDLLRFRNVGGASGEQLDLIGEMVGLSRTGNDDQYRDDIYFQIFINSSNGESETLIACLLTVTGAVKIELIEAPPARVVMTINQATRPIPSNIVAKMHRIKAAGVTLDLQLNNSTEQFIFGGDLNASNVEIVPSFYFGFGFGETGAGNEAIGGNLTELITS